MTTLKRHGKTVYRFLRHNRAVAALEYALLVGLVAVAVAAALVTFSDDVQNAITNIGDSISAMDPEDLNLPNPDTDAP